MTALTHRVDARLVGAEPAGRLPFSRKSMSTLLSLDLFDGGKATVSMPVSSIESWGPEIAHVKCSITFAFEIPSRVEKLDAILAAEGSIAALEYARKELAKVSNATAT